MFGVGLVDLREAVEQGDVALPLVGDPLQDDARRKRHVGRQLGVLRRVGLAL